MTGFPNRRGGTNPLPDWYTSLSRRELRDLAFQQGVPIAELHWTSFLPTTSDQAEEVAAEIGTEADEEAGS